MVGYHVSSADFLSTVVIDTSNNEDEIVIRVRSLQGTKQEEFDGFEVKIFSYANGQWTECFRSELEIQYDNETILVDVPNVDDYEPTAQLCTKLVDRRQFYQMSTDQGFGLGATFQLLENISWDEDQIAVARVSVVRPEHRTKDLVHPAILDAAFQMLTTLNPGTQSHESLALTPSKLLGGWFSASGWQLPETSSLRYLTRAQENPKQGRLNGEILVVDDNSSPICAVQRLVLVPGTSTGASHRDDIHMLYGITWRPHLSLLGPNQLHEVCHASSSIEDETAMVSLCNRINWILDQALRVVFTELSKQDLDQVPSFLAMYVRWGINHIKNTSAQHLQQALDGIERHNAEIDTLADLEPHLSDIERKHPEWAIFTCMARNLKAVLMGRIDPLNIAFGADGLAARYYTEYFKPLSDHRLYTLLELILHENSDLRIIEVGAGTGGWTAYIMSFLQEFEQKTGCRAFREYVYTDISAVFFKEAREKFSSLRDRMSFKVLDVGRGAREQGFEPGAFDLVLAGAVIHATPDLQAAVRNVRQLLRTGGHIVSLEIVAPEKLITGFAFGLLPGWGEAIEEWRSLSPGVDEARWDRIWKECGFSGNDLVLRDYDNDVCHTLSVLLSTAIEDTRSETQKPDSTGILLLVNARSQTEVQLATHLKDGIFASPGYSCEVLDFRETNFSSFVGVDVIIALVELDEPLLRQPSATEFQQIKDMVKASQLILWVSSGGIDNDTYPSKYMAEGFFRSLRSEATDKDIMTLIIESQEDICSTADHINSVIKSRSKDTTRENEYIVRHGKLMTSRLVQKADLAETIRKYVCQHAKQECWGMGRGVKCSVKNPGRPSTLHFVEDDQSGLGPNEVQIEAKAWGLDTRDLAAASVANGEVGFDCSGVVTYAGSDTEFQAGDRVCMFSVGCMRTYPKEDAKMVCKLPNSTAFDAAAAALYPGITALYCITEVARLQKDDRILIHSGWSSTGQMAIHVANMIGAEIFVTVASESERQDLTKTFNIQADHIFDIRNANFVKDIKRTTDGYGVDVVINSLSGKGLQASWECVGSSGRFIDIERANLTKDAEQPFPCLAANVAYSVVDLYHMAQSNTGLLSKLLKNTMRLLDQGVIQSPRPISVYAVSEVDKAFASLQSEKTAGRIVIEARPSDMVQVGLRTTTKVT